MGKITSFRCQTCGNEFVKDTTESDEIPRCPRCQGKNVRPKAKSGR
jgi:NAD-dependent SIR2 family protein deacetylase